MNTCSLREITKTNLESPTLLSPRTKSKTAYTSLQDQKLHARHRIFFFCSGSRLFFLLTRLTTNENSGEKEAPDTEDLVLSTRRIGVNSSETRWTGISFFSCSDIYANYGQKKRRLHIKKVAASSVNPRQKCSQTTQRENSWENQENGRLKKAKKTVRLQCRGHARDRPSDLRSQATVTVIYSRKHTRTHRIRGEREIQGEAIRLLAEGSPAQIKIKRIMVTEHEKLRLNVFSSARGPLMLPLTSQNNLSCIWS